MATRVQSTQQGSNPSQQQVADPLERSYIDERRSQAAGVIFVFGVLAIIAVCMFAIALSDMLAAAKAPL